MKTFFASLMLIYSASAFCVEFDPNRNLMYDVDPGISRIIIFEKYLRTTPAAEIRRQAQDAIAKGQVYVSVENKYSAPGNYGSFSSHVKTLLAAVDDSEKSKQELLATLKYELNRRDGSDEIVAAYFRFARTNDQDLIQKLDAAIMEALATRAKYFSKRSNGEDNLFFAAIYVSKDMLVPELAMKYLTLGLTDKAYHIQRMAATTVEFMLLNGRKLQIK